MTAPLVVGPVCADRYPVTVTPASGPDLAGVRVVLTVAEGDVPARLLVWTAATAAPAVDVAWYPERSRLGDRRLDWHLAVDGGEYVVRPGRGCGCGHPLSAMTLPWPVRMTRMPDGAA